MTTPAPEKVLRALKKSLNYGIPGVEKIVLDTFAETMNLGLSTFISSLSVEGFKNIARKDCSIGIEGGEKVCAALFDADTDEKLKIMLAFFTAFPVKYNQFRKKTHCGRLFFIKSFVYFLLNFRSR